MEGFAARVTTSVFGLTAESITNLAISSTGVVSDSGGIAGGIIAVCCFLGIGYAIYHFCCRDKQDEVAVTEVVEVAPTPSSNSNANAPSGPPPGPAPQPTQYQQYPQ